MGKRIVVEFNDGKAEMSVNGVKGQGCTAWASVLTKIGKLIGMKKTEEFYQSDKRTDKVRVTGGN